MTSCARQRERALRNQWRDTVQSSKNSNRSQSQTPQELSEQESAQTRWLELRQFISQVDHYFSLGKGVVNFQQMAQDLCENPPKLVRQEQHTVFTCAAKLPSILNFELTLELGTGGTAALVIKALSESTSEKLLIRVLQETNSLCQEQSDFIDRASGAKEFRVCRLAQNSTLAIGRFLGDVDAWHLSIAMMSPD